MRTFDLSPLYRSTVGFDRLFSMLDGFEAAPGYPPYNIERTGENDYRITVAVAGFGENELSIEAKENTLTIKGAKQSQEEQNGEVLYQGIAARAFERVFQLADYVVGQGRHARERPAARRSRARDSRGQEAAPDPDRQRPGQAAGDRHQGRRLISTRRLNRKRPGFPGRFCFAVGRTSVGLGDDAGAECAAVGRTGASLASAGGGCDGRRRRHDQLLRLQVVARIQRALGVVVALAVDFLGAVRRLTWMMCGART